MVDSVKQTGGTAIAVGSAFMPGLGQFCDGRNKEGALYMLGVGTLGTGSGYLINKYNQDVFEAQSKAMHEQYEAEVKAMNDRFEARRANMGVGNFQREHADVIEDVCEAVEDAAPKAADSTSKPKFNIKDVKKGRLYAGIALGVAATALYIVNIVDAYKGGNKQA